MSDKHYTNICPICDEPFFCEHERDFRCPYCRIEALEARIDKALKHLPERPGMAMGFLLEDDDDRS